MRSFKFYHGYALVMGRQPEFSCRASSIIASSEKAVERSEILQGLRACIKSELHTPFMRWRPGGEDVGVRRGSSK